MKHFSGRITSQPGNPHLPGPAVLFCAPRYTWAVSMFRTGGWSAENVMDPVTGWGEGREDERVQRSDNYEMEDSVGWIVICHLTSSPDSCLLLC